MQGKGFHVIVLGGFNDEVVVECAGEIDLWHRNGTYAVVYELMMYVSVVAVTVVRDYEIKFAGKIL
jgi:hypothetical protein